MAKTTQPGTLSKVLLRVKRYWAAMIGSIALSAVYVAMSLYIPILVGDAIDCIVEAGHVDFAKMGEYLLKVAICAGAAGLSQWVMNVLNNHVTYRVTQDLRQEAFRHIQDLPLSYLDTHPQGDMVSRMVADVDTFADGLLMGFTQFFTGALTILGTLFIMMTIRWQIALVVLCITPVSLLVARFISKRTYSMFRLQSQTRGEQTALIDETVGELKVVQAFGHENASLAEFDEVNDRLEKCSLQAIFFSSLVNPATRFVNSLVYACVGLVGALSAIGGAITPGVLTIFLSYANQYTKPFNEISGVVTELQNALACAARVFELIEEKPQTADPADPKVPETVEGAMEISHVDFSYVPEKPLIRDFNLSVKPGERVAIVGPTGCGKTTMINLLMRFYDPQQGTITLDGVNTREMARGDLRRCVGMVLQDTWLMSGTIRDNIAMGKPDATLEEIQEAAEKGPCGQFHPPDAPGLRYPGGRGRRQPVPGPEAASVYRTGDAVSATHADFGRGHVFHRYPYGDEGPECVPDHDGWPDQLHRGPPALHHPECGCDSGHAGRADHRAGDPSGASCKEGLLRAAVSESVRPLSEFTSQGSPEGEPCLLREKRRENREKPKCCDGGNVRENFEKPPRRSMVGARHASPA